MLNLRELESRWLRYKIKSYLPRIITLMTLVVIATIAIVFFAREREETPTQTLVHSAKVEVKTQEQRTPQKEHPKKEHPEEKKVVVIESELQRPRALQPAMGFMKDMQKSIQFHDEQIEDIKEEVVLEKPLSLPTREEKKSSSSKEETIKEAKIEVIEIKEHEGDSKKINISKKNTQNDIAGVIKRFKKNSSPALSLFIAKKYYEIGDYHNAYNYALITNEINRDIESSWIIFSKSLVKLGKKEMAIKTLLEYTKESKSDAAKILLDEITSGKFK